MELALSAATPQHAPAETPVAALEPTAPARLVEFRPGRFVAFPAHTTVGLVDSPAVVAVPGAPACCVGLMPWEGRQLPLLDLATFFRADAAGEPPATGHVLVLAYQGAPGRALEYGAVCARALVRLIEVADGQACDLPEDSDMWAWLALSCFEHEGQAVPVIDTARLFGAPPVFETK